VESYFKEEFSQRHAEITAKLRNIVKKREVKNENN
jgi:hypothetical protein